MFRCVVHAQRAEVEGSTWRSKSEKANPFSYNSFATCTIKITPPVTVFYLSGEKLARQTGGPFPAWF